MGAATPNAPGFRFLIVMVFAVLAVACGSSDTLSNDEYAAEIRALAGRTDAREDRLEPRHLQLDSLDL